MLKKLEFFVRVHDHVRDRKILATLLSARQFFRRNKRQRQMSKQSLTINICGACFYIFDSSQIEITRHVVARCRPFY